MANGPEFSTKESNLQKEELQEEPCFSGCGCCCHWNFPCLSTRQADNWERLSTPEKEQQSAGSWWAKGIIAVKKVREWSEIVAGPNWKTFIRRFNKTTARSKTGKFQYDPLSYALNFDEGQGQDGRVEEDWPVRDFSVRFTASKGPLQFGKDAP